MAWPGPTVIPLRFRARGKGERLKACRGQHIGILNTDSAAPLKYQLWLDGKHHARLQHCARAALEGRPLIEFQPNSVPDKRHLLAR